MDSGKNVELCQELFQCLRVLGAHLLDNHNASISGHGAHFFNLLEGIEPHHARTFSPAIRIHMYKGEKALAAGKTVRPGTNPLSFMPPESRDVLIHSRCQKIKVSKNTRHRR